MSKKVVTIKSTFLQRNADASPRFLTHVIHQIYDNTTTVYYQNICHVKIENLSFQMMNKKKEHVKFKNNLELIPNRDNILILTHCILIRVCCNYYDLSETYQFSCNSS